MAMPPPDSSAAQATTRPASCTHLKTRKLMRLLSRLYDAELQAVGLKATQYALLTHVARRSPIGFSDLAARLALDSSTLSRNLKPLITSGWIRLREGQDARRRLVTITAAGSAKQIAAESPWRTAQERVEAVLGRDRLAALHAVLDESIGALADTAAGVGSR